MRWLNRLRRRPQSPAEAGPSPAAVTGVTRDELSAALAVIERLGPDVGRSILRVEVVGEGRLEVSTGHAAGPLDADFHEFVLQRDHAGWQLVDHVNVGS